MKDYKKRDAEWEKLIEEDVKAAKSVNVRGTPTFFINGRLMRARDFQGFKAQIDNILQGKQQKKGEQTEEKGKRRESRSSKK